MIYMSVVEVMRLGRDIFEWINFRRRTRQSARAHTLVAGRKWVEEKKIHLACVTHHPSAREHARRRFAIEPLAPIMSSPFPSHSILDFSTCKKENRMWGVLRPKWFNYTIQNHYGRSLMWAHTILVWFLSYISVGGYFYIQIKNAAF